MNEPHHVDREHIHWSTNSLIFVNGMLVGMVGIVVLTTAPFATLAGASYYALPAAFHGMSAVLLLVVATVGLYLGWRLFTNRLRAFPDLQLATTVTASLSFLTIAFGNWVYIPYRAANPNSVRSWLLTNAPDIHKVFFEFKEFIALFPLPLSVAAAYIVWHYGAQVVHREWLRYTVGVLMGLTFFYLLIAFGLGAAVTKIRSI